MTSPKVSSQASLSVVFLSNTNTQQIYNMTMDAIRSLLDSEKGLYDTDALEVIVIESNRHFFEKNYAYPDYVTVIIPDIPFNFHSFLNIGIKRSKNRFVALCNNDVLFYKRWFSEMIDIMLENPHVRSFSPVQPNEKCQYRYGYEIGFDVRRHIKGWCLVVEKVILERVGYLDESFDFYYADDDYAMTLKKFGVMHALVYASSVLHLGGQSTEYLSEKCDEGWINLVSNEMIPKYLYSSGYNWILKDSRLLEGHIKFHKKWGSIYSLSIRNKLVSTAIKFRLFWLIRLF